MNYLKKLIILSLLIIPTFIYSANIRGMPFFGAQEIFERGGLMLISQKSNTILMYNTTPKAKGFCNFFVEITNESSNFEHFYFQDLQVTDQYGRRIPVKKKKTVIKNRQANNSLEGALFALSATAETINAERNAGTVHYEETIRTRSGQATTHTEVVGKSIDPIARRNEFRYLQAKHGSQAAYLNDKHAFSVHQAENYYLDNHTIRPGETYGANFQILIPKEIQKDLSEIIISYMFAGEEYQFLYRVK